MNHELENATVFVMTHTGHTYDFHFVSNVQDFNGTIIINYLGVRTKTNNTVYFHNAAGYVIKGKE